MNLLPGDLLLVRGMDVHRANRNWFRWFISWLISRLTGSEYTHSAMFAGVDVIEVDIFQKVRVVQLSEYKFYDVYRVRNATDRDRMRAVFFCWSKMGCKYDYTAVLAIALEKLTGIRWDPNDPVRWFCAELDDESWMQVGHMLVTSIPPVRVTPGDLAKSPKLQKVVQYE